MRLFATLSWIWIALAAAYGTWEFVSFAGLYRWLAELQLSLFGRYYGGWTMIASVFALALPGMATLSALEREKRRRQLIEQAQGLPAPEPHEIRAEHSALARRNIRIMLWLAPICLLVAGVAYWLGQREALPAGTQTVMVDLASLGATEPPTGPVALIGQVLADRGVTTSREVMGRIEENYYVPIVARNDTARREDFRFYLRRFTSRSSRDPRLGQAFYGNPTGVLIRNGLPEEVRVLYDRRGIEVTEPHWVLSPPSARTDTYYVVAGVGGLVGVILLLGALAALAGQRFRDRRGA